LVFKRIANILEKKMIGMAENIVHNIGPRLARQLLYLNHPRLASVLRWCVGLTLVLVVVYTANLKLSVPSIDILSQQDSTEANISTARGESQGCQIFLGATYQKRGENTK
jgi:hypothetical protein